MKILICGDRHWTDREKIAQQLRILRSVSYALGADWEKHPMVLIQGCNGYDENGRPSFKSGKPTVRGADMIAREEALKLGFVVEDFPYPDGYARGGGPIRNQWMLEQFPDLCLAFHSNIEESKGTKDMMRRTRGAKIPTEVIR
jgi:hypothetical protein